MLVQFAVRLVCGMCWILVLTPKKTVASGFFRTQMWIVMGLSTLAAMASMTAGVTTAGAEGPASTALWSLYVVLVAAGFVTSVLWTLERRQAAIVGLWGIAVISTGTLLWGMHALPPHTGKPLVSLGFSEISSAATLGAAMCGMLLGHSYLTSPTMSISPLSRMNLMLGIASVGRGVVSAVVLVQNPGKITDSMLWTWLALRWGAGIMGPLVMSLMTWQILRYRNTQAATGVLFVAVILTFIAELTATLLLSQTGLPL